MQKKILTILLILALCLSFSACGGDSGTGGDSQGDSQQQGDQQNEGNGSQGGTPEASGVYEPERVKTDELTWDFDEKTGTLSIHGEGPMRDYAEEPPEWDDYNDRITKITIDDGITSIGALAFYYYLNVTEVSLPDSIEVIDESAFDFNYSLKKITIPASLKYVGKRAFYNTLLWEPENLVFPEGLEYIGDEAFHSALKSEGTVTLPSTMKYLGNKAFTNAYISDFIVSEDNEAYCSENHAIYTKDKKEILMVAPDSGDLDEFIIPDGVEKIADECFNVIQGTEKIVIPASVKEIEEGAIHSTYDLKEIEVDEANPNYKAEDGILMSKDGKLLLAWPDGTSDTKFEIPEGVERIGKFVFYGRFDQGYTVVLPEGVKEIGEMSLPQKMKSLTLPVSLEKIDDYVFYEGIAIDSIIYKGTEDDWSKITVVDEGNDGLNVDAIQMS